MSARAPVARPIAPDDRAEEAIELNVHRGNDALGFYEREGFAPTGELSGGDVIVMRRKR